MPLLCEGEIVKFNLKDALEVLTEEEAVILDMLVSKVQDYSDKKEQERTTKEIQKEIDEMIMKHTATHLIIEKALRAGLPVEKLDFDGNKVMIQISELKPEDLQETYTQDIIDKFNIAKDLQINQILKQNPIFKEFFPEDK